MLTVRALSTAARRRGLAVTSPPPSRAEIVSSLMTLVHSFDFLESVASFLCLILDHRLWPDMVAIFYHSPRRCQEAIKADRRRASRPAASGSRRRGDRTPSGRACARP